MQTRAPEAPRASLVFGLALGLLILIGVTSSLGHHADGGEALPPPPAGAR